ncbi:hypothetical protein M409DRAFT_30097 [Zasmidium cellare ATCC 36951]|uniref:F-box domain-containing protein n=1 Tax=Zasmidium cellare ATCC 36951 TaxID=1080233 RepID=A0A6A6C186_ZASCE|nr:uncharacterized protein M409DRAFT_30097 [Zasmidium cellare ATCC 36951]KAF2159476.1 hypothetical protein M409DRAFT_30097 [Zasmidium cellare ATCC 36951]
MDSPNAAPHLPLELLCRIVGYTPRPSDLKLLCLVSRDFRDAATPALYRNVVLDEKTPRWPRLRLGRGLLSFANAGLAHVRELTCQSSQQGYVKLLKNHKDELQSIQMLLQFLPRHQLAQIDFSTIPLDAVTIATLFAQQNMLQSLALGPIATGLNQHLQLNVFGPNPFNRLRDLHLPSHLWSRSDLDAYSVIMNKAPQVSRLSVHSSHLVEVNRQLSQSVRADENLIFSKLFARDKGDLLQHRNNLRSLHLDRVDVSVGAHLLPQYFDLCKLHEFHLSACTGWSSLLKVFTACFIESNYSLRSFCLDLGSETKKDAVIEKFLSSFGGLETLRYSDRCFGYEPRESLLDLQCLDGHLSSLKQLAIVPGGGRIDASPEVGLADDFFEKISTRCTNLRQLGVIMPFTSTTGNHEDNKRYARSLLELFKLRNLRVLRIFNWPDTSTLSTPTLSDHLLDQIADDGLAGELISDLDDQMEELRCSMVLQQIDIFVAALLPPAFGELQLTHDSPLVCFDGLGDNRVYDDAGLVISPEAACYVPVRQSDIFGRARLMARRVSVMEAKYLEPENEILQWLAG